MATPIKLQKFIAKQHTLYDIIEQKFSLKKEEV